MNDSGFLRIGRQKKSVILLLDLWLKSQNIFRNSPTRKTKHDNLEIWGKTAGVWKQKKPCD